MRMLVTGGAGFIGAGFVHLTRDEHPDVEVTVVDALASGSDRGNLDGLDVGFVHGDVTDADLLDSLVKDTDVVVHFAAESHNDNSIAGPGAFVRSNVLGTYQVLEAVRAHDKRLHHISTDEVFGDLELGEDRRFTADTPYNPSSPYSATKAAADHLVRAWIRTFGVRATISNCSNNYGPRQHVEKFIPRQVTNLLDGVRPRLYGAGTNVRDWIHVDDHNAAVHVILERGTIGRTYLIGADGEASNRDVVALLLEITGHDPDFFELVADRPGHDLRYAIDASALRDELGWTPRHTSLRAGLEQTVAWYAAHRDWWEPKKAAVEAFYAARGQ